MDLKMKQLNQYYYDKFTARAFDEKDVLGFFASEVPDHPVLAEIRRLVLTREIGNGPAEVYFRHAAEVISRLGKGGPKEKIDLLYTFKDIRNALNQHFTQAGREKLSIAAVSDFLLCLISLLQHIPLGRVTGRRSSGFLCFAASKKELLLMGNLKTTVNGRSVPVTFPVLTVKNDYEKVEPRDSADTPYLFESAAAEIITQEGRLFVSFPELTGQS
ncbi:MULTISPECIES: hypothetical protein [Sporosarcina]|uniref:hypothetical protein n=1 Tax=Sporosarcina TaxID=1569 RepID=UPI00058F5823|nr:MULTISPECIES: hypothetical protein [Sporosarcina]WJY28225.1 hypothetical protein QWT68_04370 [Sporosarcina sp. 0.2-SM1T-5]